MGRSPTNAKTKLIQTAIDLIWKSSYGSVSVDDICKCANINKGSFYYYFPSKASLAIAAMEESFKCYEPEILAVFSANISPIERFEGLADYIYSSQKEVSEKYGHVCGCPFASLGSEMAGSEEIIRSKVDEIFSRKNQLFIETLQDMIDLQLLAKDTDLTAKASEIHAFILGQVMTARIQNDLSNLKNELRSGLFRIIDIAESVIE
ncbi:MAG: TetR/AcrR family transcriptional regulator [Gammaproteobacteria bacterium]|nr:MAG: TetR/AcrR family transcriptional regulator [Gammaproteobacteria bacterium]